MTKQLNIDVTAHEAGGTEVESLVRASWRDFLQLTKPGIIRSNILAAFAGFWLAANWQVDWLLLISTLVATALVMASACVFNNYLDRDMDKKMKRTQERALPAGKIRPAVVFWYATALGLIGLAIFYWLVNPLTVLLALVGMFVYVIVYTAWLKRSSTWSTSVGAISGAMPPVIGYCAISETLDVGAWLLFALLFLWQPPHFWALGIFRKEEYATAGFPLLPVVKGIKRTKWQMTPYVMLLIPVSVLFYVFDYTGIVFMIVAGMLSVIWFLFCLYGLVARDERKWARINFIISINYLMIVMIVMVLDTARI